MITRENIEQLKPFEARAIIESLRKGVVPTEYVAFFTVGRHNWLRFIEEDLDNFIAEGGAKVRFINGDYGDGKTHFMSVVQKLAIQKGFASSFVILTREVPIHKFELVYQALAIQLQGNFPGIGIRALLEHWATKQEVTPENLSEITSFLRQLPGMDLNFANGLVGLLKLCHLSEAEESSDGEQEGIKELLLQWFEGKKVSKKDLKAFHLFEVLNKGNSKLFLQSLIALLKVTGHKGLVLFLDELETVLAQGASVRSAAFENTRLLMDNTEQTPYLHLFFSLIPDVLLSEKGFKSYDALWSRVRTVGDTEQLNYRSTLVDLHKTPLQRQELVELGSSLRKIHELAYRWDAMQNVSNDLFEDICERQEEIGALREVRLYIKQIIRLLDMAEQGQNVNETDLLENLLISRKESEMEKLGQLEPAWDA